MRGGARLVSTEILVVGSGIAGLSFALKAAEHGSVTVVTKKQRAASSTNYAQGGIAAVVAPEDSIELHARDTLIAGAGLCHTSAVRGLVADGPARLRELIEWGVSFTQERGELSLGREGGHSRRRIVHAGDLTGREIERALLAALAERANVSLYEDQLALDLVTGTDPRTGRARCAGALVFDHRHDEPIRYEAPVVFLATGGIGQAYLHTTNPEIATGDGTAMAYRAGAEVANLEFVQFHPTALYPAGENAFLISEAVRGEGAILRRRSGEPMMQEHPLGSLAPRDVVAREIDLVLKETGEPHVLLDVSMIPPSRFEERFPGILAGCRARGVDPFDGQIPVVPAAHYACGGIHTDAAGRSTLPGLFAAGEVACTGVHGANRLASNSLLEAVVYSHRAAAEVPLELVRADRAWPGGRAEDRNATAAKPDPVRREAWACARDDLRRLMWRHAGIVRSMSGLAGADRRLREMQIELEGDAAADVLDPDWIELRNLIECSRLIVRSASLRKESRGLHYVVDHPYRDNERYLKDTLLVSTPSQESY